MNESSFSFEFEHKGISYLAFIYHIEDLTPEQREMYNIKEDTFYVHLFNHAGFNSFELFVNPLSFEWESNVSAILVDPEIPGIIGNKIDSLRM